MAVWSAQRVQVATVDNIIDHLNKMLPGDPQRGARFSLPETLGVGSEEESERIKKAVELYVRTWLLPTAQMLKKSLEGDKAYTNGLRETFRFGEIDYRDHTRTEE